MNVVLVAIFSLIAAAALAFVCWPLWRRREKGRVLLIGAIAAFVLAIGAGSYGLVGHPDLALRSLESPKDSDVRALVAKLAWRMRQSPGDPRGWLILGRAYLALGDANDAALAYKRAIVLSPEAVRPMLMSDYGVALSAAAGTITPEAENAFRQALTHNSKSVTARFYLGQVYAERHDRVHALALWESLLADTPANAPWRGPLLDRIALLKATGPEAPPDVAAMVQGLTERLKTHPQDPEGWQRLVRSYAVLGEADKARDALSTARKALAGNSSALGALDTEAEALHLEK